jgi:hypothetical protein
MFDTPPDWHSRTDARTGVNLTRYHGVFAPNHGMRSQIVPSQRGRGAADGAGQGRATPKHVSMSWAQRLKRVFGIEIQRCDSLRGCGEDHCNEPQADPPHSADLPNAAIGSYRRGASRVGQHDLTFLGSPRGISQRLQNVFPFEIGILRQEFINAASGSDLPDDHTHGDAYPADASLAAHYFGSLCDAIQLFHAGSPVR